MADDHAFPGADVLLNELAGSEFPVSDDVISRLRGVYEHLAGVSPDDPEFERYLREDVIEHEVFTRGEAIDISDSVLDVSARHKDDVALLLAFFVAFEWFHRREFDADRRMRYWSRFVPLLRACLGGFALYQYALSMFHRYGGDDAQSAQRERACELDDKMDELGRRFDNERIDMLEFIGFFAGIISFVIASIQLSDGLTFPTRALMVLMLMGSLLVSFGAFSALLERGRAGGRGSFRPALVAVITRSFTL